MIEKLLTSRQCSMQEALDAFDALEAVPQDFMLGRWRGFEIATGHAMDGLLELTCWYGKWFVDAEQVHPLLFYTSDKRSLFAASPQFMPLSVSTSWVKGASVLAPLAMRLFKTRQSKARLRMMAWRGKVSATMVYDDKPINDVFRKIDANRVLGLMDFKGQAQPYFFVLERDDANGLAVKI